jgi:eukaryotic-like serine/threonine-protein kinase
VSEVGRLKVERQLGEGGSSIVYLAYDTVLKRQVALKLPRGPHLANPKARERFLREAQAAALLRHPNIVPVYGAGEVAGSFHITLAYCPGPTLAEWLEDRLAEGGPEAEPDDAEMSAGTSRPPLAAMTAAGIIARLADAVDHAYQSGVLHRDIKPGNILLEPREQSDDEEFPFTPMLSDFGLALLANEQGNLTATGAVVGTPLYMAPEQVSGEHDQLGPATDVYGLGTVLYELLTGQSSVRGRNHAETLLQVIKAEPVWPRKWAPDLSRDLEAICLKCLRKSPEERYQTAAQLAEDLRRYQVGEATVARPVTHFSRLVRWSRRHPGSTALVVLLAVAVTLLIAALAIYSFWLDNLNSELSRSLDRTLAAQELTEQSELRTQELLYASDMRLAMEAWKDLDLSQYHQLLDRHHPGPDQRDLRGLEWHYLWNMGHVDSVTFGSHQGGVYFARYSSDGRRIVTAGEDAVVRLYDARTCKPELELPTGQGEVNGVAFSDDGNRIATAGDDGTVRVWDLQTREELVSIKAHKDLAFQVVLTTDGKLISCGNNPDICIWDATTGEAKSVLRGHTDTIEAIELAPDGQHLASVSMDHTVRLWDLRTAKQAKFLHSHSRPVNCVAFSRDGAFLATGTKGGEVVVFDMATHEPIARLRHLDHVHGVALSSNGAFVAVADAGGTVAIWQVQRHSSDPTRAPTKPVAAWAAHSGRAWAVAVSPNGDGLLSTGSDGTVRRCRTSTSLGWRNLNLRDSAGGDSYPRSRRWLAAGPRSSKMIAAVDSRGLLVWDLPNVQRVSNGGAPDDQTRTHTGLILPEPIVLAEGDWTVADVSADGRLVAGGNLQGDAAVWNLESQERLATWSLDSSKALGGIAISPNGSHLAAHHMRGLWLLDTSQQTTVQRFEMEDCRLATFSPDSSRLAYGDGNTAFVAPLSRVDRRLVLKGHASSVRCAAFSPDGQLIATGSNDRSVYVWNATTGETVLRLHGHRGNVAEIAFAPDGRSLVVADDLGTLKLWHVASGQELCILDEIPVGFTGVDFLRQGRGLVCTYGQHEARILHWGRRE